MLLGPLPVDFICLDLDKTELEKPNFTDCVVFFYNEPILVLSRKINLAHAINASRCGQKSQE